MTMVIERPARGQTDRLFFTGMAVASAFAVFVGFMPTYFVRSPALPALTPLFHLHGALFSSWIILLFAQTSLVSPPPTDIHRRLGLLRLLLPPIVFLFPLPA